METVFTHCVCRPHTANGHEKSSQCRAHRSVPPEQMSSPLSVMSWEIFCTFPNRALSINYCGNCLPTIFIPWRNSNLSLTQGMPFCLISCRSAPEGQQGSSSQGFHNLPPKMPLASLHSETEAHRDISDVNPQHSASRPYRLMAISWGTMYLVQL